MACSKEGKEAKGGYEYQLVEKESDYVCSICLLLIKDAVGTSCSHLFCKTCLQKLTNKDELRRMWCFHCPDCNQLVSEVYPVPYIDRKVKSSDIHCPQYKNGCEWTGNIAASSELEAHVYKECPYLVVECKYSKFGCEEKVMKMNLEEHNHSTINHHLDLMFDKVVLYNEDNIRLYKELADLKQQNNHQQQEVKNLRKSNTQLKQDIKSLQDSKDEYRFHVANLQQKTNELVSHQREAQSTLDNLEGESKTMKNKLSQIEGKIQVLSLQNDSKKVSFKVNEEVRRKNEEISELSQFKEKTFTEVVQNEPEKGSISLGELHRELNEVTNESPRQTTEADNIVYGCDDGNSLSSEDEGENKTIDEYAKNRENEEDTTKEWTEEICQDDSLALIRSMSTKILESHDTILDYRGTFQTIQSSGQDVKGTPRFVDNKEVSNEEEPDRSDEGLSSSFLPSMESPAGAQNVSSHEGFTEEETNQSDKHPITLSMDDNEDNLSLVASSTALESPPNVDCKFALFSIYTESHFKTDSEYTSDYAEWYANISDLMEVEQAYFYEKMIFLKHRRYSNTYLGDNIRWFSNTEEYQTQMVGEDKMIGFRDDGNSINSKTYGISDYEKHYPCILHPQTYEKRLRLGFRDSGPQYKWWEHSRWSSISEDFFVGDFPYYLILCFMEDDQDVN